MTLNALRQQLWDYDRQYRLGEPMISDTEYDRLLRELKRLEQQSGEPIPPDSPTQRVGGVLVGAESERVQHSSPMLSIDNTYTLGELQDFGNRVKKTLGDDPDWVIELKIDGAAISLIYQNGTLIQGITRGKDGWGDDVTHNLDMVVDLPRTIANKNRIEVRGEVYMLNSDLVILNEDQQQQGEETFKNARNITTGTISLKNPAKEEDEKKRRKILAEHKRRKLHFFAHSVGRCDGLKATNHVDFLKEIEMLGIFVTPHAKHFASFDEAVKYSESLYAEESFLADLDFEIDGLVLKVNDFAQRKQLSETSHHILWGIAYKVERYEAVTTLREIRVQVGKTGTITPVAELEPVELAGTTVSRASLHNVEEIERKDIRVGDVVVVEKAGKIIPRIVRVEKHLRTQPLTPFVFPTTCPVCAGAVSKDEGGVYIRCNNAQCPAQFKEKLRYFASRNAMDIEGLGDKLIDQLVDTGLVRSFGDLYRVDEDTLTSTFELEKTGIFEGIPGIGEQRAKLLAEHFDSLARLCQASETEIKVSLGIKAKNSKIVKDIFFFFHERKTSTTEAIEQELKDAVAKKTAKNLLEKIKKSKNRELRFFVNALSIPNVGASTARDLTNHFASFEKLRNTTETELISIENIGEKTAKSIFVFFENEKKMLDDLLDAMGDNAVCKQEVKQRIKNVDSSQPFQNMETSAPMMKERQFSDMIGLNFVTLDFETANLERSSPCEIGLTFVRDGKIVGTKSWLIKPASHHRFYDFNVDIHGITYDTVRNSQEFNELWEEIRPHIENQFVIAHNASFDFSILRKTLELYDIDYPTLTYGCTYLFARNLWLGLPSYSLDNLCRIKNIPLEHHRAATDSKATAELALLMFEEANIDSCQRIAERFQIHCGHIFPDGYYSCSKEQRFTHKDGVSTRNINVSERFGKLLLEEHSQPNPESIFYRKNVVFTGTLGSMPRNEAHQIITNIGGIPSDSVRRDTDLLVVGQQDYRVVGDSGMSSKQRKAVDMASKGHPIEIVSEEDFLQNL